MAKLLKEYIDLLKSDDLPSNKFWQLEKRIKEDRRHPGVLLNVEKSNMTLDLAMLIRLEVIDFSELVDFSTELKEKVKFRHYICE